MMSAFIPIRYPGSTHCSVSDCHPKLRIGLAIACIVALAAWVVFAYGSSSESRSAIFHRADLAESQVSVSLSSARVVRRDGYLTLSGMAQNRLQGELRNVEAVVEYFDSSDGLVKTESALLERPVIRGRAESAFTVYSKDSPEIVSFSVRFRSLGGEDL